MFFGGDFGGFRVFFIFHLGEEVKSWYHGAGSCYGAITCE